MPEIPSQAVPEERCTSISEFAGLRCKRDTVVTVTVGCVHEHIGSRSVCQHHVEGLANGRVGCWQCFEVDGHFCEMNVIAEVKISA